MNQTTFLRRTLGALGREGWKLTGFGTPDLVASESQRARAMRELAASGHGVLYFRRESGETGWLFAVWHMPETDPAEIVSDYSMNLDAVIGPLLDAVDR